MRQIKRAAQPSGSQGTHYTELETEAKRMIQAEKRTRASQVLAHLLDYKPRAGRMTMPNMSDPAGVAARCLALSPVAQMAPKWPQVGRGDPAFRRAWPTTHPPSCLSRAGS